MQSGGYHHLVKVDSAESQGSYTCFKGNPAAEMLPSHVWLLL